MSFTITFAHSNNNKNKALYHSPHIYAYIQILNFTGSDITVDDRSFTMHSVMIMDIPTSVSYFYPRLIPLAEVKPSSDGNVEIPQPIRSSIEKTNDQGAYILENGIHMFFYIGLALNPDFCQQVFGVPTAVQVNIEQTELPVLDNPLSIAVRSIINQVRIQKHKCMRVSAHICIFMTCEYGL